MADEVNEAPMQGRFAAVTSPQLWEATSTPEMAQIAAARVATEGKLVRKTSCAWLSGLEQGEAGECL